MEELNDNIDRNEKNIKSWIGEKQDVMYSKMQKNLSFNIWSAIFRGYYFLYRKMYLIGIGMIIIQGLITKIVDIPNILLQVILSLIFGVIFYPIYKWHIQRKIRKLEKNNYTDEQISEITKKKGGKSIGAALTLPVIYIVLILISMAITMLAAGGVIGGKTSIDNNMNNTMINDDNVIKTYSVDNIKVKYNKNKWKQKKIENQGTEVKTLLHEDNNICIYVLEGMSKKYDKLNLDLEDKEDRDTLYNMSINSIKSISEERLLEKSNGVKKIENGLYYSWYNIKTVNNSYNRCVMMMSVDDNAICIIYVEGNSEKVLDKYEDDVMEVLQTIEFVY